MSKKQDEITTTTEEIDKVDPTLIINIQKISPNAVLPVRKTALAAAFDIAAAEPAIVKPQSVTVVKTGLRFEMPGNVEAQIRSRSGLAAQGIFVMNSPGTVDADYRGEIAVILFNTSADKGFSIEPGDRIAQVAFREVPTVQMVEVEEITSTTDRGDGAMGSTGIK